MFEDPIVQLGGIVVVAVAAQWAAARLKIPSILLLLMAGFLVGPGLDLLDPDALFGELLPPAVSLAVGLILFEGGMSLRLREMAGQQRVLWLLVTVGVLISWVVAATTVLLFTDLPAGIAVLIGSILVVSGPTVVGPLLSQVRPSRTVSSILKWESIFIDPVGVLLAVLTFEVLLVDRALDPNVGEVVWEVVKFILAGAGVGAGLAVLAIIALRRHWVPEHLLSLFGVSVAILAFIISGEISHESGLLATTILGLILANHRPIRTEQIVRFSEIIRVLLIGVLFIVLSARLDVDSLRGELGAAIAVVAALVLIARPLAVAVATWRTKLEWPQRLLLGAVAPRGIVAASIASVFSLELQAEGVAGADAITPIVFAVIVGTVALYGLGMGPLARRIGLAEEHQEGALILGAGSVERAIARSLAAAGVTVVVATTNRRDHYQARMEELRSFYGNLLDRDVQLNLDLSGIGQLLALTPNDDVNTLACSRFGELFGGAYVFQLQPAGAPAGIESSPAAELGGRFLFGPGSDYYSLKRALDGGGQIRRTTLSDEFTLDDLRKSVESAVPLFIVRSGGRLTIIPAGASDPLSGVGQGDTVILLENGAEDLQHEPAADTAAAS
ncbi:MAG: sodium:proton antiporter [Acidimicrobiia bacterium]|nr:sodium:proton antiporter [Acidimicrobiia bacterium]NNF08675.1 sodium:proton antiporter [Acidimicrobiia bacterium]NNL70625.1 sodium:proton antiporter [Acidimicrobiia bacterium]